MDVTEMCLDAAVALNDKIAVRARRIEHRAGLKGFKGCDRMIDVRQGGCGLGTAFPKVGESG